MNLESEEFLVKLVIYVFYEYYSFEEIIVSEFIRLYIYMMLDRYVIKELEFEEKVKLGVKLFI